jgi:hypothetical protein
MDAFSALPDPQKKELMRYFEEQQARDSLK